MARAAAVSNRLDHTEADALFAALDHRVIGEGVESWVAEVLRIHHDGRDWWIDVASATDASVDVVLRLSRRATAAHAIAALQEWQPVEEQHTRIIDVMRCRAASSLSYS
jgi:hypothetical protein